MMSKQLPVLKTLLVRFKGGGNSNLFIRFFVAHSQGLKKFILRFSQGLGISRKDQDSSCFNRGRGVRGGGVRDIFSMADLLERLGAVRVLLGSSGESAVISVMASLPALEAVSFSHAFGLLLWV